MEVVVRSRLTIRSIRDSRLPFEIHQCLGGEQFGELLLFWHSFDRIFSEGNCER
jgi:hypothetical protein